MLLGNSVLPDSPGEWLFIIILIFGASMIASYLLPSRAGDHDLPRFMRGYSSLGWFINWVVILLVFATAIAYIALGHGVGRIVGLAIALSIATYSAVILRKWQRRR